MSTRKFEVHTATRRVGPVARFKSSVEARKLARRLALQGVVTVVVSPTRTVYAYTPGGVRLPL